MLFADDVGFGLVVPDALLRGNSFLDSIPSRLNRKVAAITLIHLISKLPSRS